MDEQSEEAEEDKETLSTDRIFSQLVLKRLLFMWDTWRKITAPKKKICKKKKKKKFNILLNTKFKNIIIF